MHNEDSNQIPDNGKGFAMFVTFYVRPEYTKEFEGVLRKDVEGALTEKGNRSMYLYQPTENTSAYCLFERWVDKESLEMHFLKAYTKAVLELSEKALIKPMEILYLQDLMPQMND